MYKDHKAEGGFRQVVGGCSSNTLGLSNLLSEVLESLASSRKDPYEVIRTEDMLARIGEANEKINRLMEENNANNDKEILSQDPSPIKDQIGLECDLSNDPSNIGDQNTLECEITPKVGQKLYQKRPKNVNTKETGPKGRNVNQK